MGGSKRPRWLSKLIQTDHSSANDASDPTNKQDKHPNSTSIADGKSQKSHLPQRVIDHRPKEPHGSSLWNEVYDLFATSDIPADLRRIATLFRDQSKTFSPGVEVNVPGTQKSGEWKICRELLLVVESKRSKLDHSSEASVTRQIRRTYGEIIQWVQKFVSIGDIFTQIDPVHIGLPWAGVRAILTVCTP